MSDVVARLAFQAGREAFLAVVAGRIVLCNPAAADLLGSSPEQVQGQSLSAFLDLPPGCQINGRREGRVRQTKEELPVHLEPIASTPGGEVELFRLIPGGTSVGETVQQLESLGVLAGGVAHRFNNLLTSILGFASLASREVHASPLVRSALHQIEDASRQAADVCLKLLTYAGKGRFVVQSVNLSTVVRNHAALLEANMARGGALTFDLGDDLPVVLADAGQVGHALITLLTNAVEAFTGQAGAVTIRTRQAQVGRDDLRGMLFGGDRPEGEYVVVEVADTGGGMDDAVQARLFEPFFTTKFMGRGLGLPVVLGIVRSHKGAIAVQSAVGKGTTVQMYFPALAVPATQPEAGAASPSLVWQASGTILVADDDPGVRRFAHLVLQRHGFQVLEAGSSAEAVQIIRAQGDKVGLVLLDVSMPNLDGERAVDGLRQADPGLPVVLMSGYPEKEVRSRFGGKGLAGVLQKPFNHHDLEAVARTILAPGA